MIRNPIITPTADLQLQYNALEKEYAYEKEAYEVSSTQAGIERNVRNGICWYPVSTGRSYYNSLNQLVVEIERRMAQEVEHAFEYGRPVRFFKTDSSGKPVFFNFTSFVSYVQKIRIRYALHMLSYTGARIHDIIAGCGFSSASQFNRTFYSLCQMSPSAFRKLDSKDREVVISSLDPERSEAVPSAFPPRYRVVLRKAGSGCIPGIRADILSPSDLESLKENLALIGAETLLLDIPSCFPQCRSYRRLTDRKLAEIADAGLDISVIGVSGVDIGSPDASEREEAMEECRAALHAAAALSAPIVCIHPSKGRYASFMESLCELSAEAEALGIMVSTVPIPGTSVDGIDGAVELIGDAPDVRLLLDPAALVDEDGRNNTFSFFEKVFSLAGPSIAALLLNDRLDGHAVGLGRGIMAKTYPRIASLIGCSMPLIRVGTEATSAIEDMDYIRRTFL